MKFLIKKVEGLEKRVKELKQENDKLERKSERKGQQDRLGKGLVSNLISIKVEAENLHIKEDILQELRKLKDKVDILENKSGEYSRKLPHKMDQCQTVSPEHMAESKISSHSNLIFSQAKDKKQTGKIFKKSEVRSSDVFELRQEQPPPPENNKLEEDKKLPEQLI
jgi:DNA-binding protein YbaB